MMALTDKIQEVGDSTRQQLCDRKISWWFEDEKDLKDDLEWQEKIELNEYGLEWQVSGDMLGNLNWVSFLYVRERTLYWILSFILSQWRDLSMGVIWWNLGVLVTARATELRKSWRRFVWAAGRLSRRELQQSSLEWAREVAIVAYKLWYDRWHWGYWMWYRHDLERQKYDQKVG